MNIRTLRYYNIPDPLEKGSWITIADKSEFLKTIQEVYTLSENPALDMPRLFRILISPEEIDKKNALESTKEVCRRLLIRQRDCLNRMKLKEFLRFAKGCGIGYFLSCLPSELWRPLEIVAETIGEGLGGFAKMWIIAFFPLKALIKSFGTGFHINLPKLITNNQIYRSLPFIRRIRRIGVTGAWNEIQNTYKSLKLFNELGKDMRDQFKKDVKITLSNIEHKIGLKTASALEKTFRSLTFGFFCPKREHPQIRKIESFLDQLLAGSISADNKQLTLWSKKFDDILEEVSGAAGEDGIFPWGEVPKLLNMKADLLFHAQYGEFTFAPFFAVSPDTDPDSLFGNTILHRREDEINVLLSVKARAFCQQARNLKAFFGQTSTKELYNEIQTKYISLNKVQERSRRIYFLNRITDCFEALRNSIGKYNMGENTGIPHEKGKDLSNFFHFLYMTFGKAACDLENRYKKVTFGFRAVLSGKGQRKRIKGAIDEAHLLVYQKRLSIRKILQDKILSCLGWSWQTGLLTTIFILLLVGSVFSFTFLSPQEFIVERGIMLGYKDYFITDTVKTKDYGTGLKLPGLKLELHWHPPPPIVRDHKISLTKSRPLDVYMPTLKHYPTNIWENTKTVLSGPLGMDFDAVKFVIQYIPKDPELWGEYDFDGFGEHRLTRDITNIIEEWKTKQIESFGEKVEYEGYITYIYDTFFKELCRRGIIEEYIRNSFSSSIMSTNIYYGSTLDRIKPGIDIILNDLDDRQKELDLRIRLNTDEKEMLEKNIRESKKIVEDIYDMIKEQVKIEYDKLRAHPRLLKKYVENPYANYTELQEFETLWGSVQYYTWYVYCNKRLLDMFSSNSNTGKNQTMISLKEALEANTHICSLIKISDIDYMITVISFTQLNALQQKWRNIM